MMMMMMIPRQTTDDDVNDVDIFSSAAGTREKRQKIDIDHFSMESSITYHSYMLLLVI